MKIGKPTKSVPRSERNSKYTLVRSAADRLRPGEYLPIVMENVEDSRRLYAAVRAKYANKYNATMRGNTVYISKVRPLLPASNCAG